MVQIYLDAIIEMEQEELEWLKDLFLFKINEIIVKDKDNLLNILESNINRSWNGKGI